MMKFIRNILIFTALVAVVEAASAQRRTETSVLADGTIYKIGVAADGIYQITYDDLVRFGISPATLNPKKISMFGNEAGMLPEANAKPCIDDLTEMDIIVTGEDDGSFDTDDKIMFYGQSPVTSKREGGLLLHQTNYYSDSTYYFLKIDNQQDGKRMSVRQQAESDDYVTVTDFVDLKYHEIDKDNHYKRGRKWYGEVISGQTQKTMTFPFSFANAEVGSVGRVNIGFIGASKSENIKVRFSVNGKQVMDDKTVAKVGDLLWGREYELNAPFNVDGDDVDVTIEIIADNSSSKVAVDFIDVNVSRLLRYENEQLAFGVSATSGHAVVNLLKIDNYYDDMVLLDVTNPLSPARLEYDVENQSLRRMSFPYENRCLLVRPSDFMSVASVKKIDNQNLHGPSDADFAEMLIITDRIFAEQAEEIKAIHEDEDGMVSAVAFVDEIYNEFSSGSQDVTAIRNYIRVINGRSESLKYVLLLGRGSCDYKNILGYSNNFVPPYESLNVISEIDSYVSDDYFGLMDPDEGEELIGKMDLGVGRIPVVDVAEAEIAVGKIRRYIDASRSMRSWRNDMVFISDDKKSYAKNCDALEKIVDTLKPQINISKIYADAYVRQKKSDGSYYYPEATEAIMKRFSQGAMMITYLGHGGVKGLSQSNLLRIDNIVNFDNYDRLPFVVTATCEFSAFDDPSFVSAGERMFKMNDGGAIAMYTTTRPTYSSTNFTIMKNFYKSAFNSDRPRNSTIGEIVMHTKKLNSSNSSNYVSYVLFGDPALRLAYPKCDITVTSVNDYDLKKDFIVGAMETMTVCGMIANSDGNVDTAFNGVVDVEMFDNESTFWTLNNSGESGNETMDFKYHSDVLFQGKASVVNGLFSIIYNVPRTVNHQKGKARLSLYAVDTLRSIDAHGYMNNLKVDGVATVATDNEGPDIQMFWNGQQQPGTAVAKYGVLTATISDPQGIYHYDNAIGRNIMLTHNSLSDNESRNVNAYFEPAIDDFTKGTLKIEFENLSSGMHEFVLDAWDTHDNSSRAVLNINVSDKSEILSIVDVVNSPNPFKDYTVFKFNCLKQNAVFDMTITIRDVLGRAVNVLQYNMLTSGYGEVEWDGCDNAGRHLIPGTYVYNVYVKDADGNVYLTNQKMIVTN